MTVLKYNTCSGNRLPFYPVGTLLHEIVANHNHADSLSAPVGALGSGAWVPALDFYESGESYSLRLQVPGFSKEDLSLSYHDGQLTISGKKALLDGEVSKQQAPNPKGHYHIKECNCGQFTRSIILPAMVKVSDIVANAKDGILSVTLPKAEEAKSRKINVG
jgi:HSP20 family protein